MWTFVTYAIKKDETKYIFSPLGIEVAPIGALDVGESLQRELDEQLRTSTVARMNEIPGSQIRNETKKAYSSSLMWRAIVNQCCTAPS